VVALVVAIAALVGTIAYAATSGAGSMMSRSGYSMMGAAGQRSAWYLDGSGPVRDIAAARVQAQRFAERLGLRTGEVMQFENNFYVRLHDEAGEPATEVLVDPRSGDVTLEYGAAMMWNTRYGMMGHGRSGMMRRGGMMGRDGTMMGRYGFGIGAATGSGPVDARGARAAADRWLTAQGIDARAGEPEAFPGYFTMETRGDGKVTGMISVHASSGAVLYHWWHGRFLAAAE
jgi:hypothetical protein